MPTNLEFVMNHDNVPLSKRIENHSKLNETWDATKKSIQGRDINWKVGINSIDPNFGYSPLMLTAVQGKEELAQALLERGAEIELISPFHRNQTALHIAAACGSYTVLNLLLKRGAVVNIRDLYDQTPLHLAAKRGYLSCVKLLLERGAGVNNCDCLGRNPLHFSAMYGHVEVSRLLLQAAVAIELRDFDDSELLMEEAEEDEKRIVEGGEDSEDEDEEQLEKYKRKRKKQFEKITEILQDINSSSISSSTTYSTQKLKAFFKNGTGNNFFNQNLTKFIEEDQWEGQGLTALHYASMKGHKDTVELLLKFGARVDRPSIKEKLTALMYASREGNKSIVSFLVKNGADSNRCDIHGWTALHYACAWNHRDTSMILIVEGKADINSRYPNIKNIGGITPLILAIRNNNINIIHLLLSFQVDLALPEMFKGESPIHAASRLGFSHIIQLLIDSGTNINIQSFYDGRTALMDAVKYGKSSSIICLLNNCADLNIVNNQGKTLWEYCATNLDLQMIFLNALVQLKPFAKVNILPWLELYLPYFPYGRNGELLSSYEYWNGNEDEEIDEEFEEDEEDKYEKRIKKRIQDKNKKIKKLSKKQVESIHNLPIFLNHFLFNSNGLFYGLYKIPPSCDIYLFYCFILLYSGLKKVSYDNSEKKVINFYDKQSSLLEQILFFKFFDIEKSKIKSDYIQKLLNLIDLILLKILSSHNVSSNYHIFTDICTLPSKSHQYLGEFKHYYFQSALYHGPLALYLEANGSRILNSSILNDLINQNFYFSSKENFYYTKKIKKNHQNLLINNDKNTFFLAKKIDYYKLDDFGYVSGFGLMRYIPFQMFLLEGLSRIGLLISILFYAKYGCAVREVSPSGDFSTLNVSSGGLGKKLSNTWKFIDVFVLIYLFSFTLYEFGLILEKRWSVSPSIVFSLNYLNNTRMNLIKHHFFENIFKFFDFFIIIFFILWLIFRGLVPLGYESQSNTLSTNDKYMIVSSYFLYLILLPLLFSLLQYPTVIYERFGKEILFLNLIIRKILYYALTLVFFSIIFMVILYIVYSDTFPTYSSLKGIVLVFSYSLFGGLPYNFNFGMNEEELDHLNGETDAILSQNNGLIFSPSTHFSTYFSKNSPFFGYLLSLTFLFSYFLVFLPMIFSYISHQRDLYFKVSSMEILKDYNQDEFKTKRRTEERKREGRSGGGCEENSANYNEDEEENENKISLIYTKFKINTLKKFLLYYDKNFCCLLPAPLNLFFFAFFFYNNNKILLNKIILVQESISNSNAILCDNILKIIFFVFYYIYEIFFYLFFSNNVPKNPYSKKKKFNNNSLLFGFISNLLNLIYYLIIIFLSLLNKIYYIHTQNNNTLNVLLKTKEVDGRLRNIFSSINNKREKNERNLLVNLINNHQINYYLQNFNEFKQEEDEKKLNNPKYKLKNDEKNKKILNFTKKKNKIYQEIDQERSTAASSSYPFNNYYTEHEEKIAREQGLIQPRTLYRPEEQEKKKKHYDDEIEEDDDNDEQESQRRKDYITASENFLSNRRRDQYYGRKTRIIQANPFLELARIQQISLVSSGIERMNQPHSYDPPIDYYQKLNGKKMKGYYQQKDFDGDEMDSLKNYAPSVERDEVGAPKQGEGIGEEGNRRDQYINPYPSTSNELQLYQKGDSPLRTPPTDRDGIEEALEDQYNEEAYYNHQFQSAQDDQFYSTMNEKEHDYPSVYYANKEKSKINHFQPGIINNEHWKQFSQDRDGPEAVSSPLLHMYTFENNEDEREGLFFTGYKSIEQVDYEVEKLKNISHQIYQKRNDWNDINSSGIFFYSLSKSLKNELRLEEDLRLSKQIANDCQEFVALSNSFYFSPYRYAPIFTEEERRDIFRLLLPDLFVDDQAIATQHLAENLKLSLRK